MKKLTILTVATATILTLGTTIATHSKADEVKEGQTTFYVVESGDTLSKIAEKYGVDFTVVHANNADQISNADLIFPGQKLIVAGEGFDKTKTTAVSNEVTEEDETKTLAPVEEIPVAQEVHTKQVQVQNEPQVNSGDVHSQFIANGGTEAMWNTIVLPESGGQPDVTSHNGYHGLGQTKEAWGYGSVAEQTQGMLNYANSRYGSIENAVAFRASHNWW